MERSDGFTGGMKNSFLWIKIVLIQIVMAAVIVVPVFIFLRGSLDSYLLLIVKIVILLVAGFLISMFSVNYFFKRFTLHRTGFNKLEGYFHFRRISKLTYGVSAGMLLAGLLVDILEYGLPLMLSIILILPAFIVIYFYNKTKKEFSA